MIWIHECASYIAEMQKESNKTLKNAIEKKLNELAQRKELHSTKNFCQYDGNIWVLKVFPQNARVVFESKKVESIVILFVREYISPNKYEPLWRKTILPLIEKGNFREKFPLLKDELEAAKDKYLTYIQKSKEKVKLPELTSEHKEWLNDFQVPCGDFCVYESEMWLRFAENDMSDFHARLVLNAIKDLLSLPYGKDIVMNKLKYYKYTSGNDSLYILYEDNGVMDSISKKRKLFLHTCIINTSEEKVQEEINKLKCILGPHELAPDEILKLFSKHAYKAYPHFAVNNSSVWLAIEKNKSTSNLALSPEQVELLARIDFPKFVNGQAGSGKSTMLYYLFAEMCNRKIFGDIKGGLLFLTENNELLKRSQSEVREILRLNPQYSNLYKSEALILDEIKDYFYSFDDFIYEQLMLEDDRDFFPKEKMYKFPQFKNDYLRSNLPDSIKKRYSPELSWFIITTFIKGFYAGGYVVPSKDCSQQESIVFTEMNRGDRLGIDPDTFRGVYHHVWKFYQNLQEKDGMWDRLDLVRFINRNHEKPLKKKWVVFCDEAQDFSRIELQLLIKVSEYAWHDLKKQRLVPIVFAGDPFQTVNPTGFSLANLKRLFRTELCDQLNYSENSHREIVEDLRLNYRSIPEIVRLANIIQLVRYRYLKNDDLAEPQTAKHQPMGNAPKLVYFDTNSPELSNRMKYDILLIPSDDDKSEQEVFWKKYGWGNADANLKCTVNAKGSDYERVVLYRFGDYFCDLFGDEFLHKLVTNTSFYEQQPDGIKFSVAFFFNKLYVAVTRAQSELIIVESENHGGNNFWKVICDSNFLSRTCEVVNKWSSIATSEEVLKFSNNSSDIAPSDQRTAYNNAEEEFSKGELYQDSERMRSAADLYKQASIQQKAKLATAYAYKYEKKWSKAADLFYELKQYNEYLDLIWKAGNWTSIISLSKKNHSLGRELEIKTHVAKLMSNTDVTTDLIFNSLVENIQVIHETAKDANLEWFSSFEAKLIEVLESFESKLTRMDPLLVGNLVLKFNLRSKDVLHSAARLLYKLNAFEHAIEIWSELEHMDHEEFYKASLKVKHDDPSRPIYYHYRLGQYNKVTELFESLQGQITPEYYMLISDSYLKSNDICGALKSKNQEIFKGVMEKISTDSKRSRKILEAFIDVLPTNNELEKSIDKNLLANVKKLFVINTNWKKFAEISINNRETRRKSANVFQNAYNSDADLRKIVEYIINIVGWSNFVPETISLDGDYPFFYDNLIYMYIAHIVPNLKNGRRMSAFVLGTALERMCSKYILILELYEDLIRNKALDEKEKLWLFDRWLKVKTKNIRRTENTIKNEVLFHRIDEDVRKKFPALRKNIPSLELIDSYSDYPVIDKTDFLKNEDVTFHDETVFLQPEFTPNQPISETLITQETKLDRDKSISENIDVVSNNAMTPRIHEPMEKTNIDTVRELTNQIDILNITNRSLKDKIASLEKLLNSKDSELTLAKDMIKILKGK